MKNYSQEKPAPFAVIANELAVLAYVNAVRLDPVPRTARDLTLRTVVLSTHYVSKNPFLY
jgi:hypothetical protein